MRLLLLSLEFDAGTFSGNGVYACSQARALSQLGHDILVVCGAPPGHPPTAAATSSSAGTSSDNGITSGNGGPGMTALQVGAVTVLKIELPVWGRLDSRCAWRQYAAGAAQPHVAAAVAAHRPEAVLGVDWHSVAAHQQLAAAMQPGAGAGAGVAALPPPPFVYLNYRVYSRSTSPEELEVVRGLEQRALQLSCCSFVLSRSDAGYLQQHFTAEVAAGAAGAAPLHVLLPALRADMQRLPLPPPPPDSSSSSTGCEQQPAAAAASCAAASSGPAQGGAVQKQQQGHAQAAAAAAAVAAAGVQEQHPAGGALTQQPSPLPPPPPHQPLPPPPCQQQQEQRQERAYLACCVRLSPEKEPHRFVAVLEELQRRGSLQRLGLVPFMCGAGWGSPYGSELRRRLEQLVPQCVIHDHFLGPAELAGVYAQTVLNIHPPTYDAYGMTVVEAASQGAPSLVQGGGHVGATDLLSSAAHEVVCCDMDQPVSKLADLVESLLEDRAALAAVGRRAMAKARSWSEQDNARALVQHVQQALAASAAAGPAAATTAAALAVLAAAPGAGREAPDMQGFGGP